MVIVLTLVQSLLWLVFIQVEFKVQLNCARTRATWQYLPLMWLGISLLDCQPCQITSRLSLFTQILETKTRRCFRAMMHQFARFWEKFVSTSYPSRMRIRIAPSQTTKPIWRHYSSRRIWIFLTMIWPLRTTSQSSRRSPLISWSLAMSQRTYSGVKMKLPEWSNSCPTSTTSIFRVMTLWPNFPTMTCSISQSPISIKELSRSSTKATLNIASFRIKGTLTFSWTMRQSFRSWEA